MNTSDPPAAAALRALGAPRAVEVRTDGEGMPVAVARHGPRRGRGPAPAWRRVEQIDDAWRVAEEWWREEPQERTYLRVIREGGQPLTLFRDRHDRQWFEQPYAPGATAPGSRGDVSVRSSQRRRT